jgi:hypothetical protein
MDKICYIKQPAGLGDILFCQKIAYRAIKEFNCSKVIWPVSNVYNYLSDFIKNKNENVFFTPESFFNFPNQLINDDNLMYIPLQSCDGLVEYQDGRANGRIKYKFFYDTDFSDWKDYFTIIRNKERENNLINMLNININEPYNLINPFFGTPPGHKMNPNIKPDNDYKNIYIQINPRVTIFDWLTIIENAKEIHIMESSMYYILEKLNLENVYIYSKYKFEQNIDDDYKYMKSHCNPKWRYM